MFLMVFKYSDQAPKNTSYLTNFTHDYFTSIHIISYCLSQSLIRKLLNQFMKDEVHQSTQATHIPKNEFD